MDYREELEEIRLTNDGVLCAADVVEYARNPQTSLHNHFEWDDTRAAEQYRLWQARELIRVVVQTRPTSDVPTRVYVSLTDDRHSNGGGYRTLDDVLRSETMRKALLRQAYTDMVRFEIKYRQLLEIAAVIDEMKSVRKQYPLST